MAAELPDLSTVPDGTSLADIAAGLRVTVREVRLSFTEPIRRDGKRRTRPTPERDAEIVGRYAAFESVSDIAKQLHISTTTVLNVLERCGVERRSRGFRRTRPGKPPGPLRRIESEVVVELYRQGLTQRQVAAELDCAMSTVGERLREAGIRTIQPKAAMDAEITRRWHEGQSQYAIAAAVGMSRSGVRMAIRRLGLGQGGIG
jgi:DNA invertase Pin-like site-specific DNA recombinase